MTGFDLRFIIPIIINLLKYSQSEALPWDWDAFDIVHDPNQTFWTKSCFRVFLLLLSSFTSLTISLIPPRPSTALIRFQFGNFSPHIALSLVSSLVFPQALFWFLYPAILIVSLSLGWSNLKLCGVISLVWNIKISSTLTHQYDHEEANIHIDIESEVPVPQVSQAVSPQGDNPLAQDE